MEYRELRCDVLWFTADLRWEWPVLHYVQTFLSVGDQDVPVVSHRCHQLVELFLLVAPLASLVLLLLLASVVADLSACKVSPLLEVLTIQ